MKRSAVPVLAAQVLAAAAVSAVALAVGRRLVPSSTPLGQVVVITGGSRGLGLAIAQRFARAGAKLVLAARDADELELARDRILRANPGLPADDILLVSADLVDRDQAAGLIAAALNAFGRIDVLVNNAGIIEVGPVEDHPLESYYRAMDTNFFAALHTTHAALPVMLSWRSGAIVNISSIGGKFAMPHLLPYVASKFALTGFSEGLHAEVRHKGIRVTTVCPGLMRTGGENHALFLGQVEKERRWFRLSAQTPILSASVTHAANRIYNAVAAGRAEITITPQAWLAARIQGMAPETTQLLAALANHFLLPAPSRQGLKSGAASTETLPITAP